MYECVMLLGRMVSLWCHKVALFAPGSAAYTNTHSCEPVFNPNKTSFCETIELNQSDAHINDSSASVYQMNIAISISLWLLPFF